jgi:hypothetical protein
MNACARLLSFARSKYAPDGSEFAPHRFQSTPDRSRLSHHSSKLNAARILIARALLQCKGECIQWDGALPKLALECSQLASVSS